MIPPTEKIENPYLFLMKYPHTYKWNLLIKLHTNWLKAEQLEIQTPLKKKKQIKNSNWPNLNLNLMKCGLNNQ